MSFDTHIGASLERILRSLRAPLEAELRAQAGQLDREMGAQIEAVVAETRRDAERRMAAVRETAHEDIERARASFETERQAAEARARGAAGAMHERLAEAFQSIGQAATIGEILEAVARDAARIATRAAVLIERDGQLRDWAVSGFSRGGARGQRITVPAGLDGLLGRALRNGEPAVGDVSATAPGGHGVFARTDIPATAVAWPLVVGGRTVAVLYADAPSREGSDRDGSDTAWVAPLGLLARHAAAVLELRTLQASVGMHPVARSTTNGPASDPEAVAENTGRRFEGDV